MSKTGRRVFGRVRRAVKRAAEFAARPFPDLFASKVPAEFQSIALAPNYRNFVNYARHIKANGGHFGHGETPAQWVRGIEKMAAERGLSVEERERHARPVITLLNKAEANALTLLAPIKESLVERINEYKIKLRAEIKGRHLHIELLKKMFHDFYLKPLHHGCTVEELLRNFPGGEIVQYRDKMTVGGNLISYAVRQVKGNSIPIHKNWVGEYDDLVAASTALESIRVARERLAMLARAE